MDEGRRELWELAEQQLGLIASRQADTLSLSRRSLKHLIETGALVRDRPGVLRVPGAPVSNAQGQLAAVLAAGRFAALSHTSALAHWGVRGFVEDPIHITRRRDVDDHPVRGATIHEVRFLPLEHVRTLESVPVVSPSLALLQLAGMRCSAARLGRAIDAAWSDRLVTYTTLTATDRLMSRQGRTGLTLYRELVEERGPAYVPPASNLEGRFAEILRRAGRPPMRRQVDCSDEQGWIGRVDFKDVDLPVLAEIQSERFHRGLTAERQDAERIARLRAAGNQVVEITDEDVFFRPEAVVAAVDAARARAIARLVA